MLPKAKHIIATFLLALPLGVAAQNNLLYNTFRTPEANQLNAAFFPKSTFYIQLPSIMLDFSSPLAISDMVQYRSDLDYIAVDLDNIIEKTTADNLLHLGGDVNLVGFGFKVGNLFFDFNTKLVGDVHVGFPKSAVNALLQGNIDDEGNVIEDITILDGDIFYAQSYVEGSIGGGFRLPDFNLTIGAHAKLLYGIANAHTDNSSVELHTSPDLDSISADIYYQLNEAACVPYDTNLGEIVFSLDRLKDLGHANMGVAFDLGVKYELGPFAFSLGINDLSAGIHWKYNTNTFAPRDGRVHLVFDGIDANNLPEESEEGQSLIDDLSERLALTHTQDGANYWFSIPTKINVGASYTFAEMLRAGLLFHGQFDRGLLCRRPSSDIDNTFRFNTTATVGVKLGKTLETIVGSSVVYDGNRISPFNPGAGIILTALGVQTTIMADYISDIRLVEARAFRIMFGLNLIFG